MARQSPRPRRSVAPRYERVLRVTGWRYSDGRAAWVHRALGGRFGPVFIVGPEDEIPQLEDERFDLQPLLVDAYISPHLAVTPSKHAPSAMAGIYPEDPWAGMRVDGRPPRVTDGGFRRFPTPTLAPAHGSLRINDGHRRDRRQRIVGEA